jgi:hypothetical protein
MAAGICSFDQWLSCLETTAGELPQQQRLQLVAAKAQEAFGSVIRFAEIFGRRWSFIAGTGSKDLQTGTIHKIPLEHGLGLVCTTWGTMSAFQQAAFVGLIQRLIKL